MSHVSQGMSAVLFKRCVGGKYFAMYVVGGTILAKTLIKIQGQFKDPFR